MILKHLCNCPLTIHPSTAWNRQFESWQPAPLVTPTPTKFRAINWLDKRHFRIWDASVHRLMKEHLSGKYIVAISRHRSITFRLSKFWMSPPLRTCGFVAMRSLDRFIIDERSQPILLKLLRVTINAASSLQHTRASESSQASLRGCCVLQFAYTYWQ